MTRAQAIYGDTMNLLGSDPLPKGQEEIQEMLDREHAEADPAFKKLLEERAKLTQGLAA